MRLVAYRLAGGAVTGELIRVVTTLLDPSQAPAHAVAAIDHERWEVELTLDELDTHQRLATRTLRSLSPVGVIQELYGLLLAHYVVRSLMHTAALTRALDPDCLSFTRALETVCAAILDFQLVPSAQWPTLTERLLADLVHDRLPVRRPRGAPRAVKRSRSRSVQRHAAYAASARAPDTCADRLVLEPPLLAAPPADPGSAPRQLHYLNGIARRRAGMEAGGEGRGWVDAAMGRAERTSASLHSFVGCARSGSGPAAAHDSNQQGAESVP